MQIENSKEINEKISFSVLIKTIQRSFMLTFRLTPKLTLQLAFIIISLEFFPLIQNGLFGKIINNITEVISAKNAGVAGMTENPMSYVIQFILLYVGVLVLSSIFQELKRYIEKRWDLVSDSKLTSYSMRKRAGIDIAHYENPDFQNLVNKAFDTGTWPIQTLAHGQIRNIGNVAGIITAGFIVIRINPRNWNNFG
jgi:hypothetical protein